MEVILILILASLALAVLFLAVFVWASRSGQFDDTSTPPLRILADDPPPADPRPIPSPSRKPSQP